MLKFLVIGFVISFSMFVLGTIATKITVEKRLDVIERKIGIQKEATHDK